jgi:hypothetical protein
MVNAVLMPIVLNLRSVSPEKNCRATYVTLTLNAQPIVALVEHAATTCSAISFARHQSSARVFLRLVARSDTALIKKYARAVSSTVICALLILNAQAVIATIMVAFANINPKESVVL